jgi:hypothetical protein
MKIHCAQLVEGALRNALESAGPELLPGKVAAPQGVSTVLGSPAGAVASSPTLLENLRSGVSSTGKVKIVLKPTPEAGGA